MTAVRWWMNTPLLVLVLVGCTGGGTASRAAPPASGTTAASSSTPPSTTAAAPSKDTPTTSKAAATAVAAAGLGCQDFVAEKPDPAKVGPTATESGVCTVGGTKLSIGGYASSSEVEAAFLAAQSLACGMARDTVNGTAVVAAGNQIMGLWDGDVGVSERIAAAVGGQVRLLSC